MINNEILSPHKLEKDLKIGLVSWNHKTEIFVRKTKVNK